MTREEFEAMKQKVATYNKLQDDLEAHERMVEDFKKAGSLTFSSERVKCQALSKPLYAQILACLDVEIDRIRSELAALK
jgi:hypothetical protein